MWSRSAKTCKQVEQFASLTFRAVGVMEHCLNLLLRMFAGISGPVEFLLFDGCWAESGTARSRVCGYEAFAASWAQGVMCMPCFIIAS